MNVKKPRVPWFSDQTEIYSESSDLCAVGKDSIRVGDATLSCPCS